MGLGVEVAGKFFRRRRRRPPQKCVFGDYRVPSFSDTYERSRRATGWYRLVITLRLFLVFMKSGMSFEKNDISEK